MSLLFRKPQNLCLQEVRFTQQLPKKSSLLVQTMFQLFMPWALNERLRIETYLQKMSR